VSATFHVVEADLLASLVGQLLELVREEPTQPRPTRGDPLDAVLEALSSDDPSRPTDPVLLRLFPDAYRDDDESAAEFRRFTERSLREQKAGAAATMLASLATAGETGPEDAVRHGADKVKVHLDEDQAGAWLRTLTDLRLALGTRLGVEQDDEDRWQALPEDDPQRHIHDVYDWLGFVQETLVRALFPS